MRGKKCDFMGCEHLHSFMHIVEFIMFLSSGVWILLTCGTIFCTVDFGAEFEEEEEVEPEDAAPQEC